MTSEEIIPDYLAEYGVTTEHPRYGLLYNLAHAGFATGMCCGFIEELQPHLGIFPYRNDPTLRRSRIRVGEFEN